MKKENLEKYWEINPDRKLFHNVWENHARYQKRTLIKGLPSEDVKHALKMEAENQGLYFYLFMWKRRTVQKHIYCIEISSYHSPSEDERQVKKVDNLIARIEDENLISELRKKLR